MVNKGDGGDFVGVVFQGGEIIRRLLLVLLIGEWEVWGVFVSVQEWR